MNKKDLKSGMFVETAIEGNYLVVLDFLGKGDVLINDTGWMCLSSYSNDLTMIDREGEDYDIVKVFENGRTITSFIENRSQLLWEKPEPIEYTMEELTEKIGHSFKIKK